MNEPTRKPELGARVVHCSGCDTYMEHRNRARTFAREVLDAHVYELLTIGILRCQHCTGPDQYAGITRFVCDGNYSSMPEGLMLRVVLPEDAES